ncbi:putative membrane protein [Virgibacillus natechei]|uniref:Membrane protein n=1 Tax=Virgibacillus natechei TaxID=1216297 RepID=A0ABS4IC17_9BACI|nr:DUF2269 family protein [Virgibacillus natechei]MBP1968491.1 putative membrane protein [Virgibacillus natechei]UZD13609.1 DUF2269 domain-containing protein [Virgibacillus natechei]
MTFYELLLFVHIFSAILGLGPGFVMIYVVKQATNMTQLKHAYNIRNRLHIFVMVGGTLLIITGLWMGFINTYLFTTGWYVTSLTLYLIALAFGPLVLSPRSKPVKALLKEHEGEEIPAEYYTLSKRLFFYERIENVIFLIVIALMIVKPF